MNIRDLRYFVAVAEQRHFRKAAEQCHVSQPTLSGQIKKLEQELGVALLERNNRQVMLTEAGARILQSARKILLDVADIQDIANSSQNPLSGKFRLGAFPTLATYVFPSLVARVRSAMPQLRLILLEEKTAVLIDKLKRGDIDAALLALPVQEELLLRHTLFEDEFFLAVPSGHALTQYDFIDQSQLSDQQLLLLEEGHCLRDQALEICQLVGSKEEQDFRATGLETLRQMVRAGTGITFIPDIARNPDDEGIEYLPFVQPAPKRSIALVWRKTSTRQAVMDELIKSFPV